MVAGFDQSQPIRAALLRKGLADARQRSALARLLSLSHNEVLALQHLAQAGELTPGKLGARLQLSSAAVTTLLHRLQRAGHITRHPHPNDRRSALIRLSTELTVRAIDAWAAYVADTDELTGTLSDDERDLVRRFLEATADAAERHADRLVRDADARARDELAVPLPTLWA